MFGMKTLRREPVANPTPRSQDVVSERLDEVSDLLQQADRAMTCTVSGEGHERVALPAIPVHCVDIAMAQEFQWV